MLETILSIIAFCLCIIFSIVLGRGKFLTYTYSHNCNLREIKRVPNGKKNVDYVYEVLDDSNKFIKKIVLTKGKQKILICNYAKEYKNISYYVYIHNKKNKIKDLLIINEENTSLYSDGIVLPKRCDKVSFQIIKANDEEFNTHIKIIKKKKSTLITYAIIKSLTLFFAALSARLLIVYYYFEDRYYTYFNSDLVYITRIICILLLLGSLAFYIYILLYKDTKKEGVDLYE